MRIGRSLPHSRLPLLLAMVIAVVAVAAVVISAFGTTD